MSHRVYKSVHGDAPWDCEDCGISITVLGRKRGEGQVHHIDENPKNNAIENLALLCRSCHALRHQFARAYSHSAETRQKVSVAMKGHQVSQPTRNKIGAAHRGRKYSDEHRAAMRAGWARRKARLTQTHSDNRRTNP